VVARSLILTSLLVGFLVSILHGGCDDSAFSILSHQKNATVTCCAHAVSPSTCSDDVTSFRAAESGHPHGHCSEFCHCSCHIPLLPLSASAHELTRSNQLSQRLVIWDDCLPEAPSYLFDHPPVI